MCVFQRELKKERNHEKINYLMSVLIFHFETNMFSGFVDLTFVSTSSITFEMDTKEIPLSLNHKISFFCSGHKIFDLLMNSKPFISIF